MTYTSFNCTFRIIACILKQNTLQVWKLRDIYGCYWLSEGKGYNDVLGGYLLVEYISV